MSHLGRVDYFLTQNSNFGPDDDDLSSQQGHDHFHRRQRRHTRHRSGRPSQIFGVPGVDFGFTLEGTWTVLEGTGRFTNAAGSGSMDGIGFIDPYGPAVFNFEGKISYDASDRSTK